MLESQKYAKVFRAAAKGYVAQYNQQNQIQGQQGGLNIVNSDYEFSRRQAYSMAGAFNAIAAIFETMDKEE